MMLPLISSWSFTFWGSNFLSGFHDPSIPAVSISQRESGLGETVIYLLNVNSAGNSPLTRVVLRAPANFQVSDVSTDPRASIVLEKRLSNCCFVVEWKGELSPSVPLVIKVWARNPDTEGSFEWNVLYEHGDGITHVAKVTSVVRRGLPALLIASVLASIVALSVVVLLMIRSKVRFTYTE